ncbi:hypothetical protein N9087_01395 [bacterium]|nr:hypothetical protein [bacterium]
MMIDEGKEYETPAETAHANSLPLNGMPSNLGMADEHAGSSGEVSSEEPQPTYVPAALAMGIMMLLWGILTNWIMSAAGAVVMVWAITVWVREMHET